MNKFLFVVMLSLLALLSGCAAGIFGSGGHHSNNNPPQQQRSIEQVKADGAITSRVKAHFSNDVLLKKLNVSTYRGVVTLYGNVLTHKDMERAIRVAQSVQGAVKVRSGLRLR